MLDFQTIFDFVRLAAEAAAIFLLPGYALFALARQRLDFDPIETLCIVPGLSLAAVPLTLYATTLLGIQQGKWLVVGLLALCAVITLWDWRASRATSRPLDATGNMSGNITYSLLALVFILTLLGRLWSVRGLAFPLWTDALGHLLVTQLVVDVGMIPSTYEPYAPIHDFTYHFGFHTIVAWFHWIAGVPLPRSMVIMGQIVNALVVPTTYIFAQRLFKNRSAGVTAAAIAGLLSHMPAQFVNWARYTQLDGQMVLPVAVVLYLAVLRTPRPNWRVLFLIAFIFAGLFFTHYRIFVFAALLVVILFAFAYLWPKQWAQTREKLLRNSLLIAVMVVVVLAPWLLRLVEGFGGNYARTVVGGYQENVHGAYFNFVPSELTEYGMHSYLWVLAALGAIWGIWRREQVVVALLLWLVALFALANLHLISFTPIYSNTIVILILYLPLSALCGYLVGEIVDWFASRFDIKFKLTLSWVMGLLVLILLLGLYAVPRDLKIVAPDNGFVRSGDLEAMAWIQQEIPANALFYVATDFWTPVVAHGLDAGYYLPLLAARQTIIPLQNYASDGTFEYRALVNQRLHDLAAAPDTQALAQVMRDYGITHVYIGERPTQVSAQNFLDDPSDFALLYHEDNVWIFSVRKQEP